MSKELVWDQAGERLYETGVKKCALYVQENGTYPKGVAWNGVTTIAEKPTGAEATALYADDTKYLNLISNEDLEASIEAYMYPDEFGVCDGSADLMPGVKVGQQSRKSFGLAYQTTIGNDVDGNGYGFKLHLIYGAIAAPSEQSYATINDSPEAVTFSWELKTTPVNVNIDGQNLKPTARVTIDSTKFTTPEQKANLDKLIKVLYGSTEAEARLPLPSEVYAILSGAADASAQG